ncbi:GOLPH3/VPS74 family protein [Streptomyces sp. BYX5S]
MNTARELATLALYTKDRPVEQGEMSLALAGAELLDLVAARALTVEDDRIVPGEPPATGDRLLDESAAQLQRQEPYESVEDWLWRRGNGLFARYTDEVERTGRAGHLPGTGQASDGTAALTALATLSGIQGDPDSGIADPGDDVTATVLVAVGNAVSELGAVRRKRSIENAAFDNIWRAP